MGRVEALRVAGRMQPAGEAEFAKRREGRTAIYSFDGSWALDAVAEAGCARTRTGGRTGRGLPRATGGSRPSG
jgi:hypothetical protein